MQLTLQAAPSGQLAVSQGQNAALTIANEGGPQITLNATALTAQLTTHAPAKLAISPTNSPGSPGPPGATDHGALTGLTDDDHGQYFNQTRGDARYVLLATYAALLVAADPFPQYLTSAEGSAVFAPISHAHGISDVTGLQAALDAKAAVAHAHALADVTGLVAALAAKAPLADPALTGVPTAPTAATGTNTTQLATTAFVQAQIGVLISAAPGLLDTLDEIAAALGDDPNFATTMTTALAGKAALVHTHAIADVTGLTAALAGKADTAHSHTIANVTGLQAALDGKLDDGQATAFGLSLLDDADATTARATLGLGTAATFASGAFATAAHTHSGLAPVGGTTGQVLKKNSNTDYDYSWQADATGGGGGGGPSPILSWVI